MVLKKTTLKNIQTETSVLNIIQTETSVLNDVSKQALALECLSNITSIVEKKFINKTDNRLILSTKNFHSVLIEVDLHIQKAVNACLERIIGSMKNITYDDLISIVNDSNDDNIPYSILAATCYRMKHNLSNILKLVELGDEKIYKEMYEKLYKYEFIFYFTCLTSPNFDLFQYANAICYTEKHIFPADIYKNTDIFTGKYWYILKDVDIINEQETEI